MRFRQALISLSLFGLLQPGEGFAQADRAQQEQYFEHGFQMAEVDWDVVHPALIEACKAKYPDEVPELARSIDTWRATNRSAQTELQRLLLAQYPLPADAEAMRKQFQEVTASAARAYGNLQPEHLRQFCVGGYARITLRIPEMNFVSLLENVRATGLFK